MKQSRNPQVNTVVDVLKRALKADPQAIRAVFGRREPCNLDLSDHPTVQVHVKLGDVVGTDKFEVGTLGIVNGIVEALTGERICSHHDPETHELIDFSVYPVDTDSPITNI